MRADIALTGLRPIADGFCRVVDHTSRLAAGVAAFCLGLIPALIISDLLLRVMSLGSLESVWEYSTYLMATATFLGSAHTLRTGGHIRVGLLSLRGHPSAQKAAEIGVTLVALLISLFIAWAMAELAWRSGIRGSLSATAAATPLVVPQVFCVLGSFLLCLQLMARLANIVRGRPLETSPTAGTAQ